jgi:Spy/CpxP family protein refolding chaperone
MSVLLVISLSAAGSRGGIGKREIAPATAKIFAPPTQEAARSIANKLELTEEQRIQMDKIYDDYKKQFTNLMKDYQKELHALYKYMKEDQATASAVHDHVKNVYQLENKMIDGEADYWLGLKSILTKSQAHQFWQIFEESRLRSKQKGEIGEIIVPSEE